MEPGCGGVTFLPLLGGERTPNWPHASGAIIGAWDRPVTGAAFRASRAVSRGAIIAARGRQWTSLPAPPTIPGAGLDAGRCLDVGVIYRAALEGVTFLLAQTAHRLAELRLVARELCVVGGGARHSLWLRIIADTFQLPLRVPAEVESAALGGALQVRQGPPPMPRLIAV